MYFVFFLIKKNVVYILFVLGRRTRKSKKLRTKFIPDDYVPKDGEVAYGCWTRSECFKVERGILTFGFVYYFSLICFLINFMNLLIIVGAVGQKSFNITTFVKDGKKVMWRILLG